MKIFNTLSFFILMLLSSNGFAQSEQDSTGLLGDNFSLEGALEMFKISNSPEDFEKKLNEENNYVNNLDLNDDDQIDYIKVIDNVENNVHALVLQVDISDKESQDIAVIEIEKTGDEAAILQIVGDEELYGTDKFVEPFEVAEESNGRGGPNADYNFARITVNVWLWPCVRFVYAPVYIPYVSPWRWAYYPSYWKPWRPHPWRYHFSRRAPHHVHYHSVGTHRVVNAHRVYKPTRRTSTVVRTKSTQRTVVHSPRGTKVAKTTTTTKAVKNKNGTVKAGKKSTKTKVTKKNGKVKASKKTTKTKAKRKKG